jgi:hypothetical protein
MPDRHAKRDDDDDSSILFEAYALGLKMGPTGTNFRDAVVDAVAEYLDSIYVEYYGFPSTLSFDIFLDTIKHATNSALERLVVFYTALSVWPGHYDERLPFSSTF